MPTLSLTNLLPPIGTVHSFTLFPKLPREIRFEIWAYNLPGPRIVEILHVKGRYRSETLINLQVCHESRVEALRSHPLSFATAKLDACIPFNFETDTLYMGKGLKLRHVDFRENCNREDLTKVKRFALYSSLRWGGSTPEFWYELRPHLLFPSLVEFIYVHGLDGRNQNEKIHLAARESPVTIKRLDKWLTRRLELPAGRRNHKIAIGYVTPWQQIRDKLSVGQIGDADDIWAWALWGGQRVSVRDVVLALFEFWE